MGKAQQVRYADLRGLAQYLVTRRGTVRDMQRGPVVVAKVERKSEAYGGAVKSGSISF